MNPNNEKVAPVPFSGPLGLPFFPGNGRGYVFIGPDSNLYQITKLTNYPPISPTLGNFDMAPTIYNTSYFDPALIFHRLSDYYQKLYSSSNPDNTTPQEINPVKSINKSRRYQPYKKRVPKNRDIASKQPNSSSKAVIKSAPVKDKDLEKLKIEELNKKLSNLMLTYTDYMTKKYSDQKFIVDGVKALRINTQEKIKSEPTCDNCEDKNGAELKEE